MGVVQRLGPADRVTALRAVLGCVLAGLVVLSFARPVPTPLLVGLAAVTLALDAVDGRVARRTGTVSAFGAAFDMEVDAFVLVVLSVAVAAGIGPWVLVIGAARYLLLGAARVWPWLRHPVPVRRWAKVVAAVQGVVLTVALSGVLPRRVTVVLLLVALALLAESFAHQVLWLRRHRSREARRGPAWLGAVATTLAVALVWFALTAPDRPSQLSASAFLRLPLEVLVLAAVVLALPRSRGPVVVVAGLLLGIVALLRLLDLAFYETLDRPFDTVVDWRYLGPLTGLVVDSVGRTAGVGVIGAVTLLVVLLLCALPWALLRLSRIVLRRRGLALRTTGVVAVLALLLAPLGVVSTGAASYLVGQVRRVPAQVHDEQRFERATRDDPLAAVPDSRLLTGLRGKDVLFVFVESYGRVALGSPAVRSALADGTHTLTADGFSTRSAYLTSPTFGGISWLAHSTLQSGLWVDSQRRYDVLLRSDRGTLAQAFGRAGWRTVSDVPANTRGWPEGRFYGYDRFYDSRDVGYDGPRFGYPTMPDQYTLDAFHRLELASAPRRPVMAEIDLVTSHAPWSRVPPLLPQSAVGDGSVYDGVPERLASKAEIWRSPTRIRAAYDRSVAYSLRSLVSFVHAYGDDDLVLVVLGDHQPATVVSGLDASHDVPVTVVARDPSVTDRFAGWGWQPGLRPGGDAPVWRMDRFRDRFLAGFGPH